MKEFNKKKLTAVLEDGVIKILKSDGSIFNEGIATHLNYDGVRRVYSVTIEAEVNVCDSIQEAIEKYGIYEDDPCKPEPSLYRQISSEHVQGIINSTPLRDR